MTKTLTVPKLTKPQAEAILVRKVSKKAAAEGHTKAVLLELQAAVLDSFNAGSLNREIADITGLSEPRIEQLLRAERLARGVPTNPKKERK